MTMWQELRKKYTKYKQKDIASKLNVSAQAINQFEKGSRAMPVNMKILYLGFRNNKFDKQLIELLKEKVVK